MTGQKAPPTTNKYMFYMLTGSRKIATDKPSQHHPHPKNTYTHTHTEHNCALSIRQT